MNINKRIYCS